MGDTDITRKDYSGYSGELAVAYSLTVQKDRCWYCYQSLPPESFGPVRRIIRVAGEDITETVTAAQCPRCDAWTALD